MDLKFHEQVMNICARDAGITVREMNSGEDESSGLCPKPASQSYMEPRSSVDLAIRLWAGQPRNLTAGTSYSFPDPQSTLPSVRHAPGGDFPGIKRPGRGPSILPSFRNKFKERTELFLHSPHTSPCPAQGYYPAFS